MDDEGEDELILEGIFVGDEGLSGLVYLDQIDVKSVKPFRVRGLSNLYVVSSKSHNLSSLRIEELALETCLQSGNRAIRLLGKICIERKLFLFRITL